MSANAFIAGYTRLLSPIHGSDAEDKLYDEQSQQEDQSSWPVHAVEVDHIRLRQRRCHDIHQRSEHGAERGNNQERAYGKTQQATIRGPPAQTTASHEDEYRDQQVEQQPVRGQHVDNQQIVHGISFRGAIPFNLRMAKSATSCQVIT